MSNEKDASTGETTGSVQWKVELSKPDNETQESGLAKGREELNLPESSSGPNWLIVNASMCPKRRRAYRPSFK